MSENPGRSLPDDPRSLAFGQYIENDEGVWEVVGHTDDEGLPIIRKCDPDDVPEYRCEPKGGDDE